jgi:hypothetical protein
VDHRKLDWSGTRLRGSVGTKGRRSRSCRDAYDVFDTCEVYGIYLGTAKEVEQERAELDVAWVGVKQVRCEMNEGSVAGC